jgi:hypothetical protein
MTRRPEIYIRYKSLKSYIICVLAHVYMYRSLCALDLRRSFLNRLHAAAPVNNDILFVHSIPTFIIISQRLPRACTHGHSRVYTIGGNEKLVFLVHL